MSVETIAFDLSALVADTTAFWRAEAEKKGLILDRLGDEVLPTAVAGDPTRLRQILNNLISNAIKFTPAGAVTLTVTGQDAAFEFSVTDTGRGMTPAELSRLFAPFEQGQVSTARTHGGTGLGLSIARHLVESHGGYIWVESQEGVGSTFSFSLPVAETASLNPLNVL